MAKKTRLEKWTAYDPAEDLGSDEAIAVFMAEATLKTTLAVMNALGVQLTAKIPTAA